MRRSCNRCKHSAVVPAVLCPRKGTMKTCNLIVPSRSGSRTHAANQSNDQFRQLLEINCNLHSFLLPGRLKNATGFQTGLEAYMGKIIASGIGACCRSVWPYMNLYLKQKTHQKTLDWVCLARQSELRISSCVRNVAKSLGQIYSAC